MRNETEIYNARIKSTHLGFEDHGILTAQITVETDCTVQSAGGYGFGHSKNNEFIPHENCAFFLHRVLTTLRVQRWEDLEGVYVRIERRDGLIVGIGHIVEDSWFHIKDEMEAKFKK